MGRQPVLRHRLADRPARDRSAASVAVGGAPTSLASSGQRLWVGVAAAGGSHRGGTLVIVTPGALTSSTPVDPDSVDPAFYTSPTTRSSSGWPTTRSSPSSRAPARTGCGSCPTSRCLDPGADRRRQDLRVPDPSGDPLLGRPAAARRRLPPRDRAPVPRRISQGARSTATSSAPPRAPQRPRSCDLSRGIVTDDAGRHGHLPPHRARPRVPVQTDRVRLLGAGPARDAGPRDRLAHRARHRPVPDRRAQRHRGPVRPQPVLPRVVPRRPAGRQSRRDRVAQRADRAGRGDRGRAGTSRLAVRPTPGRPVPASSQLQHPAQLHSSPQSAVEFAPLNTHLAPFNDVRVRQALNYAIDRAKIVAAVRRAGLRHPDLPADRARPARLPPLLPVHAAPPRRRRLERP